MKLNKLALVALAILTTNYALALSDPIRYSNEDIRNAIVYYDVKNVIKINGAEGYITTLNFPSNEKIVDVVIGSENAWTVQENTQLNKLFLKPTGLKLTVEADDSSQEEYIEPTPENWHTNLIVITDKRLYQFDLNLVSELEKVNYKVDISVTPPPKPKPVLTAAQKKQAAERKAKQDEEARLNAIEAAKKQAVNNSPVPLNWNYQTKLSKPDANKINPTFVYDDGKFMYLGFKDDKSIPAIFRVINGQESIIASNLKNTREGTIIQIHGLYDEIILRQGDFAVSIIRKAK